MVKYKFRPGKRPPSQAPRIRRVAYSPPTLEMKQENIVTSDQTKQSIVITTRGVSFFNKTAQGVSNAT